MTRTVAVASDSMDFLEDGALVARLDRTTTLDPRTLAGYMKDWTERGAWPLAATHFPPR